MGLPQFESSTFASQCFWLGLCVLCLLSFVKGVFAPRVIAILEMRDKRIQGDLDKAKEIYASAQKVQVEYNEKITQNKIKARHQREEQLAEFKNIRVERILRLQRSLARKQMALEKGNFLNAKLEDSFADILLKNLKEKK